MYVTDVYVYYSCVWMLLMCTYVTVSRYVFLSLEVYTLILVSRCTLLKIDVCRGFGGAGFAAGAEAENRGARQKEGRRGYIHVYMCVCIHACMICMCTYVVCVWKFKAV
jgi:hypothetical protein